MLWLRLVCHNAESGSIEVSMPVTLVAEEVPVGRVFLRILQFYL